MFSLEGVPEGPQSIRINYGLGKTLTTSIYVADDMETVVQLPTVTAESYANWATRYFANAPAADGDADGDGISNMDEYIAGTDPTNLWARFGARLQFVGLSNVAISVQESVPGRVYDVLWQTNLLDTNWIRACAQQYGIGGSIQVFQTNSIYPRVYYRAKAKVE